MQTDTYHVAGNLIRFLQRSSDNGGAYCLVETLTAPGAGAPPNRHPTEDEAFYVLYGTFDFTVEGETISAAAGTFVKIPRGAFHAFANTGDRPGRLLIINTPGQLHDAFFSEAGEPMPGGTRELPAPTADGPDVARLLEVGRRNGMEFLAPGA